jgi:glycosyltransferase involved in cell wall biosynthesis
LVSIVIPVYNGANYLREAIDSALAQTYPHVEILVVNDGSRDEGKTEAIALSYGDKIRYIAKENGGVATALNRGVREMKGEYFSWLSHDDVYYPHKVEAQVRFLAQQPQKEIVLYSNFDVIDKDSRLVRHGTMTPVAPRDFVRELITRDPIHGCTTLVPKSAFDKTGLFNESLRTTQDYDLWYRMAKRFDFVGMDQRLIGSRTHDEQGTVTLAATVVREINALLAGFVRDLDASVVRGFSGNAGVVGFYAAVAQNFTGRGFFEAAAYVRERYEVERFATLREALPGLLRQYTVRTMVDLGGDAFAWFKDTQTELTGLLEQYVGLVKTGNGPKNQAAYGNRAIRFVEVDETGGAVPPGDLVLGRDVLINSSFDDILGWLERVRASGAAYLLVATYTGEVVNKDKRSGPPREINLCKYPFNLPPPAYLLADRDEPHISHALWRTAELPYLKIRAALKLIHLKRKVKAGLTWDKK